AKKENFEKSLLLESARTSILKNSGDYWCLDSGCSSHMSANKSEFKNFREIRKTLSLANNNTANIA
ncbi:unnamed protein product, partial [Ceratitis capitata]